MLTFKWINKTYVEFYRECDQLVASITCMLADNYVVNMSFMQQRTFDTYRSAEAFVKRQCVY